MPADGDFQSYCLNPTKPQIQGAAGRGRCALPCLRPRGQIPLRARAQIHALRRAQGKAVRAARFPRLRAQRHRAGELPRHRQHARSIDALMTSNGKARGVAVVKPTDLGRRARGAWTRRGCAACGSISCRASSTPRRARFISASPSASSRSAGTSSSISRRRALDKMIPFLEGAADRRSCSTTCRCPTRRRASIIPISRRYLRDGAGPSEHLGQGDRTGAHLGARARLMTMSCRSPAHSSSGSPTACCGVRTGRIRT